MKRFLITLVAVLIGGFLALLAYDRFVVKPRVVAAAVDETALSAQQAAVDLQQARADARDVAAEVETSVQRRVDNAREALRAQAKDEDRRALATDAVRRATMFRVALTEFYRTNGRWPRNVEDAGLPSPEEMRGPGVKHISLGERGAVIVVLDEALAANSKIVLRPKANASTGIVDWTCELEGDANLKTLLPRCEAAKAL